MKIRDLVNFDMLFPNMQRKIYLRDLVFEIFTIEFRPFFDKFLFCRDIFAMILFRILTKSNGVPGADPGFGIRGDVSRRGVGGPLKVPQRFQDRALVGGPGG